METPDRADGGIASALPPSGGEDLAVLLPFAALLITAAEIDIRRRVIPNRLVAAGALWAIAGAIVFRRAELAELLLAGAGSFLLMLLAALTHPAGMGMGDVKLVGVMGLYLGSAVVPALVIAFLAGWVAGAAMVLHGGVAARKTAVPFAPFLAVGGIVGLLAGPQLVGLYAGHLR